MLTAIFDDVAAFVQALLIVVGTATLYGAVRSVAYNLQADNAVLGNSPSLKRGIPFRQLDDTELPFGREMLQVSRLPSSQFPRNPHTPY
jgi:hypothetical protein